MAKSKSNNSVSTGHQVKFLEAANEIAGKGVQGKEPGGRMWIRTIEEGTTYGAFSADGDIAIINDYSHQDDVDVDFHFSSVGLGSIESDRVDVVGIGTGIITFTPTGNSAVGVFGCSISPMSLPSIEGVMESTSKHMVGSHQMEAVIRAFAHVAASYVCMPVTLGTKSYMVFSAKGRKWDMTVMCHATKTTKSVIDAISKGWIAGNSNIATEIAWDMFPREVRRLMAIELGLTKRKYMFRVEEKLLAIPAHKAFQSLSIGCIQNIGGLIGVTGKKVHAHDVLDALISYKSG